MKPDAKLITIGNNKSKIKELLNDLVIVPRLKAISWSKITKQTPNIKVGYPGQHLASVILGMEGDRTGARGDDIVDGTEVKSCSRVDQVDRCTECESNVMRLEDSCPSCGSKEIKRNNDSKWLFSVKSEHELHILTKQVPRVALTLADYPNFDDNDFDEIRIQLFEIWNGCKQSSAFTTLMSNYYHKIYLEHIKNTPQKTPAPKNFWPYSYQFYRCCPIKVFEARVKDINNNPTITIPLYIAPDVDRSTLDCEVMPYSLLNSEELLCLAKYANKKSLLSAPDYKNIGSILSSPKTKRTEVDSIREIINNSIGDLNAEYINILPLRDTDKPTTSTKQWQR